MCAAPCPRRSSYLVGYGLCLVVLLISIAATVGGYSIHVCWRKRTKNMNEKLYGKDMRNPDRQVRLSSQMYPRPERPKYQQSTYVAQAQPFALH